MRRRLGSKNSAEPSIPQLGVHVPMVALVQTLAVAKYLSFHRAAQAVGTSQSSVSARVKALEDDLGIIIFDRNTRGVRLTEAGRRFVTQVGEAISILDDAIKTAGMQARGTEGELRIGVSALATGCFLDRVLEQYHVKYSSVRLQITEGTACNAQVMVRDGRLDVAFMACTHEIPDLNSRVIWRDRLMVGLPAKHRLAKLQDVGWRQLSEETFLVRQGGTGPQVHALILLRSAGRWPIPHINRLDISDSALLSMISAGHGISLLVEEKAVACGIANVAFLPIRDESEAIPFSAVWSPSNRDPALMNLLDLASKAARSQPESGSP